ARGERVGPGRAGGPPQRPPRAAQRGRPADLPPAVHGFEGVRGEYGLRVLAGAQHLARRDRDLPAVPVGQRLDPAAPFAHHQGPEVDAHIPASRGEVVVHIQLAGPPGGLDCEVLASPLGPPVTEGAHEDATSLGAEPAPARDYRHESTLGHFWGERPVTWTVKSDG